MKGKKTAKRKNKMKNMDYLKDVPPEKAFWVSNGWVIRNMEELPNALENMTDETYAFHVNAGKNDYATWTKEVIGDKQLAITLRLVKGRRSAIEAVKRRIKQLKA
jgi:hypothetical protein